MISYYVTTHNRWDLARTTLVSLAENTRFSGPVTVVDDASDKIPAWVHGYANRVVRNNARLRSGLTRKRAFELFLESNDEVGFFLDSDLVFNPDFDLACVDAMTLEFDWSSHFVSPYRSLSHAVRDRDLPRYPDWVRGTTLGGATMVGRRAAIRLVLDGMETWDDAWDWRVSDLLDGVIKPKRSLVRHLGYDHPESLHPGSTDRELV